MGDVFNAMNRARRERGQEPHSDDPSSAPQNADPAETTDASEASSGVPDVSQMSEASGVSGASGEFGALDAGSSGHEIAGEGLSGAMPVDVNDDAAPALPIDHVQRIYIDPISAADVSVDTANDLGDVGRGPTNIPEATQRLQDLETNASDSLEGQAKIDPSQNGYAPEVIVHHDKGSAITEQYRAIRTQILAKARNRSMKVHVITSSAPAEGKSVSTVNLGITFGELKNQKILLLEGDLRRPSFHKLFHREGSVGLLQLLNGEVEEIDDAVQPTVYSNLDFIPAGGSDHVRSTELLSSPRMTMILEQLKQRYDHIFIDSPPVVSVTDAAILGAMADQVLLVVRLFKTPVEVVDRAKRLLRANNCEVAGAILTHLKVHMPKYLYKYAYGYQYYGYYGYGYGYGEKESKETKDAKGLKDVKEVKDTKLAQETQVTKDA